MAILARRGGAIMAMNNLWWFEKLWIEAGQSVPLS
jgi:hypothetical protein